MEPNASLTLSDPLREDFRNFLYLCMQSTGKSPSPLQYDVAQYIQFGHPQSTDRFGVTALRNFGKSWITAAYAVWELYRDPNKIIMCVSGNSTRAQQFIGLCRKFIQSIPQLQHLIPDTQRGDKDGAFRFDCGARTVAAKDPSVVAYGIGSMIVGAHVDIIIADDVQTPQNSQTVQMRQKIYARCMQFQSVLNPGGRIIYLGTPHHRDSNYNRLRQNYKFFRWPARFPDPNNQTDMKDLAPYLRDKLLDGTVQPGQASYPQRFPQSVLMERQAIMGPTIFSLQMLLNTSLADEQRYPLKLRDFIVMPVHGFMAPQQVVWGTNPCQNIPSCGLKGDHFNQPIFYSKQKFAQFTGTVMAIDPAGSGIDQIGYCVAKFCLGMVYITASGGLTGGPTNQNLTKLAQIARRYDVKRVVIQKNFGDGMFGRLLAPVLGMVCGPIGLQPILSSNVQKELRIINVLQPVMAMHRIVIDTSVANDRILMTQISNITRQKGSLKGYKDDRIEAMSMAVNTFLGMISIDPAQILKKRQQAKVQQAARRFLETFKRPQGRSVVQGHPSGGPVGPRPRWGSKALWGQTGFC